MKKAIYLLSVFFCIIAISACQPTPEKEIVVHKAAEQLEATLVESDDKEADSTFICPSKLNEEIQMPHFRFVADTDIEIGQAEGFHVYEATKTGLAKPAWMKYFHTSLKTSSERAPVK